MGLATALTVGGTALNVFGSLSAGSQQAGDYRAQAAQAELAGREALKLTSYKVRLLHEAGAQMTGEIEAEAGKAGLVMSGTPLSHLVDTARQVELSAAIERRAGLVEKQRYDLQAQSLKRAASSAKTSGLFGAAGGLIGGLGKLLG